jgi:carboxyl-terminal processing protease
VYLIGGDTCGKPYGFYPKDNCGTTYFSIQFQGVNEAGFGDYLEGFSATRTDIAQGARLPGCTVADDLSHELGNAGEGQLAAALAYRTAGSCPIMPPPGKPRLSPRSEAPDALRAAWRPPARPWREVRLADRPAP